MIAVGYTMVADLAWALASGEAVRAIDERMYKTVIEALRRGTYLGTIGVILMDGVYYAFDKIRGVPDEFREPAKDWVLAKIQASGKETPVSPGMLRYYRNIVYRELEDCEEVFIREAQAKDNVSVQHFRTNRRLDKLIADSGKEEVARATYVSASETISGSPYYRERVRAESMGRRYWLYAVDYMEPEPPDVRHQRESSPDTGGRAGPHTSGEEARKARAGGEDGVGGGVSAERDDAGQEASS